MTDSIADYLTRVRNAIQAKHKVVNIPASNIKKEITKTLMATFVITSLKIVTKAACNLNIRVISKLRLNTMKKQNNLRLPSSSA